MKGTKQMKETTLITVNELQKELETVSNRIGELEVFGFDDTTTQRKMLGVQSDLNLVLKEFKVITSRLENEIIRLDTSGIKAIYITEKGKTEFERSKKMEKLRQQGNTTDMFKTMFGQG
jgi:oligoendopeptidase F